jgi:hypothetical protein
MFHGVHLAAWRLVQVRACVRAVRADQASARRPFINCVHDEPIRGGGDPGVRACVRTSACACVRCRQAYS